MGTTTSAILAWAKACAGFKQDHVQLPLGQGSRTNQINLADRMFSLFFFFLNNNNKDSFIEENNVPVSLFREVNESKNMVPRKAVHNYRYLNNTGNKEISFLSSVTSLNCGDGTGTS